MGHRWVVQNIASTSIEPYFAGRPASNEDWDLASVLDRSRGGRTPPNSFPHIYFFFTFPFVLVVGGRWWGAPPVGTKAPPNTAASYASRRIRRWSWSWRTRTSAATWVAGTCPSRTCPEGRRYP